MHIFGLRVIPLDFPLAIAALVQVTKVLEILLSPAQQKWIQTTVETVTLLLAEIKPLRWFQILQIKQAQRILTWTAVYVIIFATFEWVLLASPDSIASVDILIPAFCLFLSPRYGMMEYVARLINWLYSEGRFRTFAFRLLCFYCLYIIFTLSVISAIAFLSGFFFPIKPPPKVLTNVVLVVISMWFLVSGTVIVSGSIVILAQTFLLLLSALIRFAEFITWKIVEYNKGAVAAISGFLTLALGIITAVFHFR
jgi:hypothetical protein